MVYMGRNINYMASKICPCLVKLQVRYERWTRQSEVNMVTPFIIAVAWSRGKLPLPLQRFKLVRRGSGMDLEGIKGRLGTDSRVEGPPNFYRTWRDTRAYGKVHEEMLVGSLTTAITRSIGFSNGTSAFPYEAAGDRYHSSFFHRLRAFHHHPHEPPLHSYDILLLFEHLEELDVSNFHFKSCPPAVRLPLCRTPRVLHIRDTPLDWMDGRIFKRVVECRIEVRNQKCELGRVRMPACRRWNRIKGRSDLESEDEDDKDYHGKTISVKITETLSRISKRLLGN